MGEEPSLLRAARRSCRRWSNSPGQHGERHGISVDQEFHLADADSIPPSRTSGLPAHRLRVRVDRAGSRRSIRTHRRPAYCLAATPAAHYPRSAAAAATLADYISARQHLWGLQLVLDGITTNTTAAPDSRPRPGHGTTRVPCSSVPIEEPAVRSCSRQAGCAIGCRRPLCRSRASAAKATAFSIGS